MLIAAADVEANYLLVLAYQYTDITSVCILDAFTVPVVIVLSAAFFGEKFSMRQLGAAALCVAGIAALVGADIAASAAEPGTPSGGGGPARAGPAWVGDLLVLLGATIYGASNVAQAQLVTQVVRSSEYLARLGGFGALIALTQTVLLERDALVHAWTGNHTTRPHQEVESGVTTVDEPSATSWAAQVVGLEAAFIAVMCGFYILIARLLARGSSPTLMNLSLLTADFWSVAIGVGLLHTRLGLAYAASFALVIIGLLVFHSAPQRPQHGADSAHARASSGTREHTSETESDIHVVDEQDITNAQTSAGPR